MKIHNLNLITIEVVYEGGKFEIQTLTPIEYAALKRSNKWKDRITVRKICEINIRTKTL